MRKYNFFKQDAVRPTEEQQFQFLCPQCGKPLLPHRYNGSPLSGTVHLEATCPHCGWDGHRRREIRVQRPF